MEGVELNVERKWFKGSKGEENYEAFFGKSFESSNILIGASWGQRHPLAEVKRSYSNLPYDLQPSGYQRTGANPTTYILASGAASIRDYTPATCNSIGGFIVNTITNTPHEQRRTGPARALA